MGVRDVLLRCEVFCGSQQLTTTHPLLSGGEGQKTGEQGEGGNERGREGHWCSCSSHREEKFYIVHDHTSRNINISLTECPIPHSLVHFFDFSLFFRAPFCPLQIVWALTLTLIEMKEEITVLICAYFAFFWISPPKIIHCTPGFA